MDYYAQVWLNGALLGEHAGGYLPFEFEIANRLNWTEANELAIRVTGPIDDPQRYPEFSFSEIPHGKQSWYGPLNGIWQPVWLECRALFHLKAVQVQPDLSTGGAVVAHSLDDTLAGYIREGGHLLLADHLQAVGLHLPGVQVKAREGTPWSGDWASSFAWIRRQGPLANLPAGPLLDDSFDRVMPEHILTGFSPLDFAAYVYAGLCVGWIHKPVALIGVRRYGQGRAVVTTLRLTADAPGADPTATSLLDALIKLTLLP